jgi:uncharacterized Fe-S cluster protein YjdI
MEEKEKSYSNNEITVYWKPALCSHSAICLHGLPNVFNLDVKPWINIYGAPNKDIINVVNKCPSGALSYSHKNEKTPQPVAVKSPEIKVSLVKDGPIIIKADCQITDSKGIVYHKKGTCSLCVCGLSKEKPFCDGSHYEPKQIKNNT